MKSQTNKDKIEALKINNDTYNKVLERDNGDCILCQLYGKHKNRVEAEKTGFPILLECHHFIPRSQLGMGIEQNLVMICKWHHIEETKWRDKIENYLKSKYANWNKEELKFKKGLIK